MSAPRFAGPTEGSAFITGPFLFLLGQGKPAQVGNDQEIKALSEMNELQEFENDVWSRGREVPGTGNVDSTNQADQVGISWWK